MPTEASRRNGDATTRAASPATAAARSSPHRTTTPPPESCAVAFNPSITGGGESEDTALVGAIDGVELLTRTPDLPELELDGLPRPAVVEL
jgi:hypothetical protein